MVNYNLHYQLTKYRFELSAERKQAIHLLALTMGEDDPLKPDYSKFIAQPKKKASTKIEPLYHGHLSYAKFLELIDLGDAATKIQAVFRSRQERKVAELAAKKQAFLGNNNFQKSVVWFNAILQFRPYLLSRRIDIFSRILNKIKRTLILSKFKILFNLKKIIRFGQNIVQ